MCVCKGSCWIVADNCCQTVEQLQAPHQGDLWKDSKVINSDICRMPNGASAVRLLKSRHSIRNHWKRQNYTSHHSEADWLVRQMPEQWTAFHTSWTIPVNYPRGGYVNAVSTEESTPALWFPNFSFTTLFFFFLMDEAPAQFSLEGSSGRGRRSPVKLGGIMCVKHTGVRYQHFASRFIAGGRQERAFSALSDVLLSFGKEK